MASDEIAMGRDLQIASYGEIPGTDQTQFMINASFGGGLFEALTLTVLVPSDGDDGASQTAALARARELAAAFCRQATQGRAGPQLSAGDTRLLERTIIAGDGPVDPGEPGTAGDPERPLSGAPLKPTTM